MENSSGGYVLFNDTWSQNGHLVSCMTIPFLNLQITISDIRLHMKWAVSLVIPYGHFNLPRGFVWVCIGKRTHFIISEGKKSRAAVKMFCKLHYENI